MPLEPHNFLNCKLCMEWGYDLADLMCRSLDQDVTFIVPKGSLQK